MSRLMVINYGFPPFGGAASRRVTKLVKYLDRQGWQSVVITAPRIINPLIDESSLDDVPASCAVIRTPSLEPVAPPGREASLLLGLRRVMNIPMIPDVSFLWAVCAVPYALRAMSEYKPRAIVCSAPEFTSFLVGAVVKARSGKPLIVDYRDEWSNHPLKEQSALHSPLRRAKQKLTLALEARLAHYADRLVANTPAFKEEFTRLLAVPSEKIRVISNGFDTDDFPPPGEPPSDRIIVTHLGSIDHESLVPVNLLEALDLAARAHRKNVDLRLVGNIRKDLKNIINGLEFNNLKIEMTSFLSARAALAKLWESHLNLILIDRIPGKERYHNIKLFDYLYSRRPMLVYGPGESMIAEVARKSGLGRICEWDDDRALNSVFEDFLSGEFKVVPDEEYISRFDWTRLSEDFLGMIEDLI